MLVLHLVPMGDACPFGVRLFGVFQARNASKCGRYIAV